MATADAFRASVHMGRLLSERRMVDMYGEERLAGQAVVLPGPPGSAGVCTERSIKRAGSLGGSRSTRP
jgi:hypothetical protein